MYATIICEVTGYVSSRASGYIFYDVYWDVTLTKTTKAYIKVLISTNFLQNDWLQVLFNGLILGQVYIQASKNGNNVHTY